MTMRVCTIAIIAYCCLAQGTAMAVPNTVNFTGRITQDGTPVTDGTVNLRFELFSAATGATSTGWTEDHTGTEVANGIAYVELGSTNGLDESTFDGAALFLELTVNGDVQSPRIAIGSVPYAIRAATADTLGSLGPGDVARATHNHDADYLPVNSARVAGTQQTSASPSVAITATSHVSLRALTVPAHASGVTAFVAHVYLERAGGTTGRYELEIRRSNCFGTIVGGTLWRPPITTSSFVADAVTLTGFDSGITVTTTYHLCARKFDGSAPTATAYHRGLIAHF